MAKDSVRLKKKKDKQRLQKRFPKAPKNATYNELKQREAAADKAKEQREARYQRNLEKIKKSGLDLSITKSTSEKQVDEMIRKEKNRLRQKKRRDRQRTNIKTLMAHGLSREEAEEFKNVSDQELQDLIHVTYKTNKYIGVCWYDHTGETNMITSLNELKYMDLDEKIAQIHKMYHEALDNPGGSNEFQGVARFVHGNSKEYVEEQLNKYKDYTMVVPYNYVNIGISNEFSAEGIADMLYLSMSRTTNQHRKRMYEDVRYFMKMNVPEIYRRIWE